MRSDLDTRVENAGLRAAIAMQRELANVGLDLKAVMQRIADRTRELTGGSAAAVRLLEGDDLVLGATSGDPKIARPYRLPIANNLAGHAMRGGHSLLCLDTETDDRVDFELASARGVRSMIAVPLLHAGHEVGVLLLYSRDRAAFGERDVTTMELLSVVLSAAMAHAAEFEAKREQVDALARFQATFAGALTGMLLIDTEGIIVDSNPAMHELLGYDASELEGRSFAGLVHPEDRRPTKAAYLQMIAGGEDSVRLEYRLVRRDGEVRSAEAAVSLVRDPSGTQTFSIAMIQDVTKRKEVEAALVAQSELNEYQALHDALTGLANRSLFRDRTDQALRRARRSSGGLAVLVIDLDRFKEINDALGHAAGDALLIELSRRLEAVLRESDTVARLGGDEFGLLLPDPKIPNDVLTATGRVRRAIEGSVVVVEGLPLSIEVTIGIALYPEHGEDVDTLLQCADVAMYKAKEEHTAFTFYDDTANRRDTARLTLVGELRRAIEQRELTLYYQPQAMLADGEVRSVEALLRWNHPGRGLVLPDDFIPLAQQTGLMKPLTLYVLEEALRQSCAWQDDGLRLSIAVNLSNRNLVDLEFPTQVGELLERWNVEPALLTLEITESTMLVDPVRTKAVLARLSAMGIRLSIDDFGTGYSSLSYLKRAPFNEIKVDRSFVMSMDDDEDDAAIVRSTVDLGRNLGLEVVAEGVESKLTLDRLNELGCTAAQGYYLSRPVPAPALRAWLEERRRPPAGLAA